MDYTLNSLINILRKRLQDEEFDSELLKVFINNAINEILGEDKYPFMERIDTYTANAKGEINLPLGYSQTFYLYANKDGQQRTEIKYISPEEFFDRTSQHQMVWTKFANTIFYKLRLNKEPNAECPFYYEGWNITHLYLANPVPLKDDTDVPPIPVQYMEAIILGAMARAEEYRDNFDYSQIYRNEQDQILTNMKLRYGPGNLTAKNRAKLPFFGGYADDRN